MTEDDARSVLDEVLEDQALAVLAALDDLRLSPLDSVHEARVALRRLRGSLKGFGPLLESEAVAPLLRELRWLAGELADTRDVQVAGVRVRAALEWVPAGAEEKALLDVLDDAQAFAVARTTAALTDPRMAELQSRLHGILIGRAESPAAAARVPQRVADDLAGLVEDLAELGDRGPHELHDLRKRVKRARAMLAAVAQTHLPTHSGARRLLKRLADLQDQLGLHQDAVMTAALLRDLAPRLGTAALLAERLAEHEDNEAAALRSGLGQAAEGVHRAALRLARRTPGVHLSRP